MTAAVDCEFVFLDPLRAVVCAQNAANATGWAFAVVRHVDGFEVVVDRCRRLSPVLERCLPLACEQ